MPTSRKVKKALFAALPPLRGTLYELGAGWGSLAFPLARRNPHLQVHAIEISPLPYVFMRLRARLASLPNLHIQRADFFQLSLSHADILVTYLYPKGMHKLQRKLETELPSHALAISHTFAFPDWQPEKTLTAPDLYKTPIYFYRFATAPIASPAKVHAITRSHVSIKA